MTKSKLLAAAAALAVLTGAAAWAADPAVIEALGEIAKYEELAKSLQPGDKATGKSYLDKLNAVGAKLRRAPDKQDPQWRDAAERYNALQKRIVDTSNQAAAPGSPTAPAAMAAPARLNSSDQARLARVQRNIQSLDQDVDRAHFQAFTDEAQVNRFKTSAANQRTELGGLPADHPDVAKASAELDQVDARLAQRIAEASSKMGALGDVEAQLAEMDKRIQTIQVPAATAFRPDVTPEAARGFGAQLASLRKQSVADMATLDRLEQGGIKDQRIAKLRHWAGMERQRRIDETAQAAGQSFDGVIAEALRKADFHAATDPADADHRANRLLGEGQFEANAAEFKQGIARVETAKAFDAAVERKDAPDRAAQGRKLAEALTSYEAKHKAALDLSRMPPPGMTEAKYLKIAEEVLKSPNYKDIGPIRRMLINSQRVQSKEKKEADIRTGTVSTTATIYHWVWDEYQVATAEKVGERYYVFFNTLKYFHKGGPTTPTERWLLSDRFRATEILEQNIEK